LSSVSLVTYSASPHSLQDAVAQCGGFDHLDKKAAVLIKPNLVTWSDEFKISPFGVFTTTRLVEDLVILLRDFGCTDISIGEGSVQLKKDVGTMQIFTAMGYNDMAKRYDLKLVDFNATESVTVKVREGLSFHIAKEAMESGFFIDMPVLKTHPQSKVSLAIKNLKGCLKTPSRKRCHNPDFGLEYCFSHLADYIKPALTIVDGIYALELGAFHFGNAYRKNVIVASRDILAADMVAAKTIGFDPQDIVHFQEYATRHGKSLNLSDYDIQGEALSDYIKPLKWDWPWNTSNTGPAKYDKLGITGVSVPKYDETLCSGCSPLSNMINIMVVSAFKGQPLPRIEILNGKKMQAKSGFDKTVLVGNCIIHANRESDNICEAIKVSGCPPDYESLVAALRQAGLAIDEGEYWKYMIQQGEKYDGKEGYLKEFFQSA
jgi:uncharacterized protein (DUF362 family)